MPEKVDEVHDDTGSSSESLPEQEEESSGLKLALKTWRSRMEEYLDGETVHPLWKPATTQYGVGNVWDPDDLPRLKALGMLEFPPSKEPDMLLYRLGRLETLDPSFAARLEQVLAGDEHIYLSNASGCGKTRMCFEVLARHCGFYLTCQYNFHADPYGSHDYETAVSHISSSYGPGVKFKTFLPELTRPSHEWQDALEGNRHAAAFHFRRLILARMLVFSELLRLTADRGLSDDDARMKWLMLQFRTDTLFDADVFQRILCHLSQGSDDAIAELYATLSPELVSRVSYIVIDGAQIALSSYPRSFAVADNSRNAPLLRELIIHLGNAFPNARLIIASALYEPDVISEALANSGFAVKTVRHFHTFSSLASAPQCASYLRHFLGPTVSDDDCATVYRWMNGRYRFIDTLIALTMKFGARDIIRIMDTLIYTLTGYERPGSTDYMPDYLVDRGIMFPNEKLEFSPGASFLRLTVMKYAVQGLPTTAQCAAARALVRLSVGFFGESENEVTIFEPLAFLNLARWLASSPNHGIHGVIRRRLAGPANTTPPLRDAAFVEGLSACIFDAVRIAPTLTAFLDFLGRAPPWAHESARVVLPRCGKSPAHCSIPIPHSPCLIHWAETPADVFEWLRGASEPFLIPDPHLGADLMFMLEVDGEFSILVFVHAYRSSAGGEGAHHRALPPGSQDFYAMDSDARTQFLSLLDSLPRPPLHGGVGKRAKQGDRVAKSSTLHLLCFERPSHDDADIYDPPVANVKFDYLLQLERPVEFAMAAVDAAISHPSSQV